MATVKKEPQQGLEDEVLADADTLGAMKMFKEADEALVKARGVELSKARDDAKDKLFKLLPPHDGQPHVYRIGPWKLVESPAGPLARHPRRAEEPDTQADEGGRG